MLQGVQQALANNQTPAVDVTTPTMIPTCLPALEETSAPPSRASTNSVTSDLTIQIIQQQMEMMQAQSKSRKQKRRKNNLTKYCHTHGLCNHTSPECRTPVDGYKNEATLQNRMGDSVWNIT